jgi:hypothetical protein
MLTESEKRAMKCILYTMAYNSFSDLKKKYIETKDLLSDEALNLLLFGDREIIRGNSKYRVISQLENRWCLKSILTYHLEKTGKVNSEEYASIFSF